MRSQGRAWGLVVITVLTTAVALGSVTAVTALPLGRDLVTFANVRS